MVYAKINIELLKKWSESLSMDQTEYQADNIHYKILRNQLQIFQRSISCLKPGNDWRCVLSNVSPLFQECFFKTSQGAIRLANYYEYFLVPADIETKKQIISGYADSETIGEVILYDGKRKIGSIGPKSDLIWSVFYNYFIVESEFGEVYHTLSNHEEILSLQLYNIDGKDEQIISEYINNLLLKLSIEKRLNFKRIQPIDLWKNKGTAKTYGIQVNRHNFESIPLAYMQYGTTCANPRMAFLHFYQVLEYFFVRAQNASLMSDLDSKGILSDTVYDDNVLRRALKAYTGSLKEIESLKLVLQKVVDVEKLKQYISSDTKRIQQYTIDTSLSSRIQIHLDATDKKIVNKLAERIYFFRCAIAHAKGDVDEYLALPEIGDTVIRDELPLLKDISYRALIIWGK